MNQNHVLIESGHGRLPQKGNYLASLNRLPRLLVRLSVSLLVSGVTLGSLLPTIATPLNQFEPAQVKQTSPDALPIPLAIVRPNGTTISIQMINATGAELNYQVIGDTQFRSLGAQAEVTLQDLTVPTTITFRRNDGGLISATIEANNPSGTLVLILQATEDFAVDRTALRIEPDGAVYLN